jgi:beta-lactamase family protein/uncharacterized protein DUF3471
VESARHRRGSGGGEKIILLKGYGYRDLEKQLPVTPNTLFPIGAITKSFTVSTLGMEMDEGKDLKDYVGDYGNPGYGVVSVVADGSGFKLKINKITASVAHLHYDVFQVPDAPFDPFAKLKVSFSEISCALERTPSEHREHAHIRRCIAPLLSRTWLHRQHRATQSESRAGRTESLGSRVFRLRVRSWNRRIPSVPCSALTHPHPQK